MHTPPYTYSHTVKHTHVVVHYHIFWHTYIMTFAYALHTNTPTYILTHTHTHTQAYAHVKHALMSMYTYIYLGTQHMHILFDKHPTDTSHPRGEPLLLPLSLHFFPYTVRTHPLAHPAKVSYMKEAVRDLWNQQIHHWKKLPPGIHSILASHHEQAWTSKERIYVHSHLKSITFQHASEMQTIHICWTRRGSIVEMNALKEREH